jgi:hypothetical protein
VGHCFREKMYPLQKVTIEVIRGKSMVAEKIAFKYKELVLSLDESITIIESERQRMEKIEKNALTW